jgi:multidrug efflux pump subunit AcrB
MARWRERVGNPPEVVDLIFTEPSLGPTGYPIEIRLLDDDLTRLASAAIDLKHWFGQFEGVHDLTHDLRPGKPERRITLKPGALGSGLTAASLATQLRAAYFGETAREIQVGDHAYEVDVRLAASDRDSLEDLDRFRVTLPNGAQAPLGALASIAEPDQRPYGAINRFDGRRGAVVRGDVDPAVANVRELLGLFRQEFAQILGDRYPGMDYAVEGETAASEETGKSLFGALQFGLLAIFLIASFQFHSYKEPLIIIAAIPLSAIGVIWGHFLLGYPLTMPSMIGFVSLAGIVVNDAILLVIFIQKRTAEGADHLGAIKTASRDRFRAVTLTSLTTIAGLAPLLLEQSLQAQILIPLAISIIFGMFSSTVLVLIVIPCLYAMFDGLAKDVSHLSETEPAMPNPA